MKEGQKIMCFAVRLENLPGDLGNCKSYGFLASVIAVDYAEVF